MFGGGGGRGRQIKKVLTGEQLERAEHPGVPRSFEDVREEGRGGGEQGEGPDHRDRDPDPHGDRARLPPTARNVPEAEIKCRVLYCSAPPHSR